MQDLFAALALVLVIEGALYALFPGAMRRMLAGALELPDRVWRAAGLAAATLGVLAVWLIRG